MTPNYAAEIFRAGSGARARKGRLDVEAHAVVFRAADDPETVELPFRGLVCRLSGYDNRTFFFAHPDEQGAEIAVRDQAIRSDPALARLPVFQEAQRVGRATHIRFWGCVASLFLTAAVLLGGAGLVVALFLRWLLGG